MVVRAERIRFVARGLGDGEGRVRALRQRLQPAVEHRQSQRLDRVAPLARGGVGGRVVGRTQATAVESGAPGFTNTLTASPRACTAPRSGSGGFGAAAFQSEKPERIFASIASRSKSPTATTVAFVGPVPSLVELAHDRDGRVLDHLGQPDRPALRHALAGEQAANWAFCDW